MRNGFDLLGTSEKAGVDRTEGDAETVQMLGNGIHITREVAEVNPVEAARVRGEQSGWDRHNLIAHNRQRGHDHGECAPAEAGEIVDCRHARRERDLHKNPFDRRGRAGLLQLGAEVVCSSAEGNSPMVRSYVSFLRRSSAFCRMISAESVSITCLRFAPRVLVSLR